MQRSLKKTLLVLAGILAAGIYVYQKRSVFFQIVTVFLYAAAFMLLMSPLCRQLEYRGIRPAYAAALAVCIFALSALLIVAAFVPYLVTHSIDLIRRITPTLTQLLANAGALLSQWGIELSPQKGLSDVLASAMSRATAIAARGSMALATQAGNVVFSLVIAYYLLRERTRVANHLILLIPLRFRTAFLSAMLGCRNAVMGYLSGVLKTSVFVALATLAGLLTLGVRDALLLSFFMGIFEILPYIGPVLAAIPILLSTLGQGLYQTLLALGVVVLVQQIEGNFISPYFTASSTSIHPLAALVSVFVLGSLFGLWGILLAVPLVVTLRSTLWSFRQAAIMIQR